MLQEFIRLFATHRLAPNLLMLAMFIAGLYSIEKLNTQFFPDFAIDVVTIRIAWPGASAEDVQTSITIPVEQDLRNIANVKNINSYSVRGLVVLNLEVASGAELNEVTNAIKQQLDSISDLAVDSEKPNIQQIIMQEEIGNILITTDGPAVELITLAKKAEKELIAQGINKVLFTGLQAQEISIQVDIETLYNLGLTLNDMADLIFRQSQDISAGSAGRNQATKQLRAIGKVRDVASFEQLPLLTQSKSQLVRLGDVAIISLRPKEDQTTILYQGKPAVKLRIMRGKNDSTLKSARIMNNWVFDARERYPDNIDIIIYDESWKILQQRISLLIDNGFHGLIMVIILLFLFLNSRVALWVTMGIPACLLATWGVMYLQGGSINMLSLFGMIMALGIIVDDAIVVGEDTLTHVQQGEPSLSAALSSAQRMFAPVVAASLTTIAAFLPMMLVDGPIGAIIKDIPVIVICVIIVSLIECFLILPGHLHHSLKKQQKRQAPWLRERFDAGFCRFKNLIFRPLVTMAVNFRVATCACAMAALMIAIGMIVGGRVPFTFFPEIDSDTLRASVRFASGTENQIKGDYLKKIEQALLETETELGGNLIRERVTYFGQSAIDQEVSVSPERIGMVRVELNNNANRTATNAEFIALWHSKLPRIAGLEKLIIDQPRSGPPGKPIEMFITGAHADKLKQVSLELQHHLKSFDGVSNVDDNLDFGSEQFVFSLTPQGKTLGVSTTDIARQLRAAFDGIKVQSFYQGSEEIDVRVMLIDNDRNNFNTLYNLPIILSSGQPVPLIDLVDFTVRQGIDVFRSNNGDLTAIVKADVDIQSTNAGEIIRKLEEGIVPATERKHSVNISFKGNKTDQDETMYDMKIGLVLALILIYIILAWVFVSYTWPLAVIFTIPFGLTGAIFGHSFLEIDLTIMSLFGLFGLSGIVINDSIVLLTFYKRLKESGVDPYAAVIEASCQRLRAVLLTSLTTIAGLTPILFETSLQAQFLIPMATSIVFGLLLGTLLILLVVPSMILILENATMLLTRKEVTIKA
tara:strand:+ start:459 stop:3566 length:3108 start_codon:yes stop_codon:yes gene_type:complete